MTTRELARLATTIENGAPLPPGLSEGHGIVIGITGPPGAGKSTLVDALIGELRVRDKTVAVICVDPSSRATGGAILGDRVRMQRHHTDPGVFIRSMASRGATGGIARATSSLAQVLRAVAFDIVFIETMGIGQDEIAVASYSDATVVVLVPGMGDGIQAVKAGVMEIADVFVINKSDRPGADELEHDLETTVPVFRTVATDARGVTALTDYLLTVERRSAQRTYSSIDHIGVAVESIDKAIAFYELLGLMPASREAVPQEKVSIAMLPVGDTRIELLQALAEDSTIAKFIDKRGPGIHHIALRVPDLNATIATLRANGIRLVGEPRPGAGGHLYVFVHPESTGGVLWELTGS